MTWPPNPSVKTKFNFFLDRSQFCCHKFHSFGGTNRSPKKFHLSTNAQDIMTLLDFNNQAFGNDGFVTSESDEVLMDITQMPTFIEPEMLPYSKMVDQIPSKSFSMEPMWPIPSMQPSATWSSSSYSSPSFEPKPIGPKSSIQIVSDPMHFDHRSLQSMSNLESLSECLSPLLPTSQETHGDELDELLMHCGEISRALMISTTTEINTQQSLKTSDANISVPTERSVRLRASHLEQWGQRFQELIQFRMKNGHCLVPLEFPENPRLSHWVKRQRAQYRLKHDGKHSTLTDERREMLEQMGFIWDSHKASWEEKFQDLQIFKQMYGHCNVPTMYPRNPQLASWLKCQRRQLRAYYGEDGNDGDNESGSSRPSSSNSKTTTALCPERVNKLIAIGLPWQKKRRTNKASLAKRHCPRQVSQKHVEV